MVQSVWQCSNSGPTRFSVAFMMCLAYYDGYRPIVDRHYTVGRKRGMKREGVHFILFFGVCLTYVVLLTM